MTLESHIDKCREAYVSIETVALHVTEQLPNKRKSVQSLLDLIDGCMDPKICLRVANINDESNAMHNDWEEAVAYLLPVEPVAKRQNGSKRKISNISGMESGGMKVGTGANTGVEIWYHKKMPTTTSSEKRRMNFVNGVNPLDQMRRFMETIIEARKMDPGKDQRMAKEKGEARSSRGEIRESRVILLLSSRKRPKTCARIKSRRTRS